MPVEFTKSMMPREVTAEQCSSHAVVYETYNQIGYAIWYPQMGGYVGKAIAVMDKVSYADAQGNSLGGCVDVFVWHDGEFPFTGEGGKAPVRLHHCDPSQFIEFGQTLDRLLTKHRTTVERCCDVE